MMTYKSEMPIWEPSVQRIAESNVVEFIAHIKTSLGIELADYDALQSWSLTSPEMFWRALWTYLDFMGLEESHRVVANHKEMISADWFPDTAFDHCEHILRGPSSDVVLVYRCEDRQRRTMTRGELAAFVSCARQALVDAGIGGGDRVAGILPNIPEAVGYMLAVNSLGAIWTMCAPDFGPNAILDRLETVAPKILITCDGYIYKGCEFEILDKISDVTSALPSIEKTVVYGNLQECPDISNVAGAVTSDRFIGAYEAGPIRSNRRAFNDPAYVLFSSGTTGKPKSILHGQGGLLLQLSKENKLQYDLRPNEVYFYFTSTGWNMWYWLIAALCCQATVVLYDGNPLFPRPDILFDIVDEERINHFGISPNYLEILRRQDVRPMESHELGSLRTVLSTGSPLSPECFDFVYQNIHNDVHLVSLSGGTEVMATFASGDPTSPVWRGELQKRSLGMATEVFDEDGNSILQQQGELVCTASFPSQPVGFLNDDDGSRYRAAYFERYPGIWHHGDFAEITAHNGVIIYGRSDATLKPGGIRIGTAEIYNALENIPEVEDSIVVGQNWQNDVRVVLFVKLTASTRFDDALKKRIRDEIRSYASPRHAPQVILNVDRIPRTKTGKLAEIAVRDVIHGRAAKSVSALEDPDALSDYAALVERLNAE